MTGISEVPRNPILVSECLCLFWYTGFNGITSDPWTNVLEFIRSTTANSERLQHMWTSNELSSAGDGHVCNLLSLISCLKMSQWQMRDVFSTIITSGYMEECQILSFISVWADSTRQMLYYGISSKLLGLQSFPESWEHEVIKNNYWIQHRSCKQEGMGLRRRCTVARVCLCVCVHVANSLLH